MNLFEFDAQFNKIIIGTDEAGRGPAAGGVFASAVCFTKNIFIPELNDSKKLTKKKRESIYDIILNETINSTVCVEVEEIEKINILNASLKAMKIACENVACHCEELATKQSSLLSYPNKRLDCFANARNDILILVDGNKLIKNFPHPQKYIVKGDGKSASIAAASVLAKVTRDRYMEELHEKYPQYNWAQNAGYLTPEHLNAIDKYGLTPHHRPLFLRKHFSLKLQ